MPAPGRRAWHGANSFSPKMFAASRSPVTRLMSSAQLRPLRRCDRERHSCLRLNSWASSKQEQRLTVASGAIGGWPKGTRQLRGARQTLSGPGLRDRGEQSRLHPRRLLRGRGSTRALNSW